MAAPIPPNARPGGSWFLLKQGDWVQPDHRATSPCQVVHRSSGVVMNVTDALIYQNNNKAYDVLGRIIDTRRGTVTPLQKQLLPVLPLSQNGGSSSDLISVPLDDGIPSPRRIRKLDQEQFPTERPPGTLAGGEWYEETLPMAEGNTKRLLYLEIDRDAKRFFTVYGVQVQLPSNEYQSNSSSNANGSSATAMNGGGMNGHHHTRTMPLPPLPPVQGPPGTKPGGRWYRQKYSGTNTKKAASSSFFSFDTLCGYEASTTTYLDERWIYREEADSSADPNVSGLFVDMNGQVVHPYDGELNIMPPDFSPYDHDYSMNHLPE